MKYQLKSWLVLGVVVTIAVLSVLTVVKLANKELAENKAFLTDLYQIEHSIKEANAAIREAALAPTDFLIEEELKRLNVTTASTKSILARLSTDTRLSSADKLALDVITTERIEYKLVQAHVLEAIRAHDKHHIWDSLLVYRKYQVKYSKRIDDLILIHENHVGEVKDILLFRLLIIVVLLSGLQVLDKFYSFYRWKLKNRLFITGKE